MKIIVFAGGVGTRLWPLSRKNTPKQFGKIIGDYSTLQHTVKRLIPVFPASDIYIATGERYKEIVANQLPEVPLENFIYEPEMRDNGPAIGLAGYILAKKFPDTPIAILWSDHIVKNEESFRHVLKHAEHVVDSRCANFVFIGQKSRFPNQNVGWIQLGEKIKEKTSIEIYKFEKLIYRPGIEDAEKFFKKANFVWNLGYFVTTSRYIVDLFKKYAPKMDEELMRIQKAIGTDSYSETLLNIYPHLEKISFDDLILQKMPPDNIVVISTDLGWSDVGAWEALKEALTKSEEENLTQGKVLLEDCRDSLLFSYTNQLCVGIDLDKMLIINTEDVLLVCPKTAVPKIKKLVESLTGTSHEHLT